MLSKDIKTPLLDEAENQVQVHEDYQYEGGNGEVGKFYTHQMDTFKIIDIDNWSEIKKSSETGSKESDLTQIIDKITTENMKVKVELERKNSEM